MRKRIFGRRLKRDTHERKALFRSLMASLVIHGKIRTTEAKAKAIKGEIEKLVTQAKKNGDNARKVIFSHLPQDIVVDRIISEIAPKFLERPGGYTRIMKLGPRVKDNASMVILTWVEEILPMKKPDQKRNKDKNQSLKEEKTGSKKPSKAPKAQTAKKSLKTGKPKKAAKNK